MQMCQNKSCPRKETSDPLDWCRFSRGGPALRCSVCEKVGIPRHETLFCSERCFKEAWSFHSAAKHPKTTDPKSTRVVLLEKNQSGDGEHSSDSEEEIIEPEDPDDAGGGYVEGHIPTSLMDENHGGQGHWDFIFNEKSYVPRVEDVGRVLRIECRVLSLDGNLLAGPIVVYTESVLAAPKLPPRRALQAVPGAAASLSSQSQPQFRFRIVSYNILAEIYATKQAYPYCDPWSLTWPYRRSIILQELNDTQGDIICLQEVQADHYSQSLQPAMSDMGYDSLYKQKTRESMGQYGKVDGCAIFWKKSKFIMVENYSMEFNEIVKRNANQLGLEDGDKHRFISRLSKDNVAQVIVLEALARPPQQQQQRSRTSNRICVVNTHLYSNHTRPAIKLWQTVTLLKEIEQFVLSQDLALMICGDFNSEPDSAVYQYLSRASLDDEHTRVLEEVAKNLADVDHLMPNIELESALWRAFGMEPQFTNYTRNFKGTLDYIWYTPSRLKMMAVSTPPSEEDISANCEGLPSVQYPSDHILLCCDAALNLSGGGGGQNASLSTMALRQQLGLGGIHSTGQGQIGNKQLLGTNRLTQQQQSGRR